MQANGDIYDGYWKNDMRHGTGIKKYCNKEINWTGTIVNIGKGSRGYSITVNNWDDGLIGYFLHNIEYAEIK